MSSTYHGDQFQLRRRTTISKPSASTSGSENQRTPTSPLLSGRSQSPTDPRRSVDDGDTVQARASEATESDPLSPSADNGYARQAGAGFSGRPKPITRSGWLKFVTGWSVHLPALISTIAVVIYSRKRQYWYSEEGIKGRDSEIIISADAMDNMLQLAAKIHELLILASLSSIALAMFRRRLITDGVRLGFLTGGYRVGDLDYLRTMAFWRQGVNLNRPWEILLAGFVVFATILTTVVGPASAVLLVPALGWYRLEHAIAFKNISLPLLYNLDRGSIWPDMMADGVVPFAEDIKFCTGFRAMYHPLCPAGGFSELFEWARSFRASDFSDNLRFQFPPTKLRRELVFTPSDHSIVNSTTLCTTPPHFLMVSLGLFWDYFDDNNHNSVGEISNSALYRFWTNQSEVKEDILQPFVQSKCRLADPSEHPSTQRLDGSFNKQTTYPAEHLKCFDDQGCQRFQQRPLFVDNYTTPWLAKDRWQDRSVTSGFLTIGDESSVLLLVGQLPEKGNNSVYVCNFLASWVNSTFTVDPKESDVLKSTLSEKKVLRDTFEEPGYSKPEVIRFRKSFTKYLMPPSQSQSEQGAEGSRPTSPLDLIVNLFATLSECEPPTNRSPRCLEPIVSPDPREIEAFLSKIFGVYLTEFLARTAVGYGTLLKLRENENHLEYLELNTQFGRNSGSQKLEFVNETHAQNVKTKEYVEISKLLFDTSLPIDFAVEQYGYGSGHSGPTVRFALAIMAIYLGVIAVYATAVGVRHVLEFFHFSRPGKPVRLLSVIPWSDLQDLIVLALKTPPPANPNLMDSGAGVSSNGAWENVVRARADDELNVQLVLDDRKRTKSLDYTGATRYY